MGDREAARRAEGVVSAYAGVVYVSVASFQVYLTSLAIPALAKGR